MASPSIIATASLGVATASLRAATAPLGAATGSPGCCDGSPTAAASGGELGVGAATVRGGGGALVQLAAAIAASARSPRLDLGPSIVRAS
jgi:hypothetical protein